jgi:hypothetical protein
MALWLLVDLYHFQNLREDGGIGRQLLRQEFERIELRRDSQYTIWGFRSATGPIAASYPTLCHRDVEEYRSVDISTQVTKRENLDLIEWVPHLFEDDKVRAEIIHPLGMTGSDSIEDRIGRSARAAGLGMLTEQQSQLAAKKRTLACARAPPR